MITLATTVFELVGKIAVNISEATSAIDETVKKAEEAETPFKTAMDKLGTIAKYAGAAIAAGVGVASAALGNLLKESLNISGQVEQGIGGAEAIFGDYAASIHEHAKEAYASMGVSIADYYKTANKMGSLFKGTGADAEDTFEMTVNAMQRASDVAALMGIDINWAMESVAGMAKGNFTMMDNLGVAMTETTLKNYALGKGIQKTWEQMSKGEQIAIAYELFMERTSYAMGQYTKENDTYAGSLNTVKAAWKNFLAGEMSIEEAMPHFESAGQVMIDRITKLLPHLVTGLTALASALIPYIDDIVGALAPVVIPAMKGLLIAVIKSLPDIIAASAGALKEAFRALMETIGLGFLLPNEGRHENYIANAEANAAAEAAEKNMAGRFAHWTEDQAFAGVGYIRESYNNPNATPSTAELQSLGITGKELDVFMQKVSEALSSGLYSIGGSDGDEWSWFEQQMSSVMNSVLSSPGQNAAFLPGLLNTPLFGAGNGSNGTATMESLMGTMVGYLQQIAANGNRPIYLNTGALVGGLLPGINDGLGRMVNRGNYG